MESREDKAIWQARWINGETRWDQGHEHPALRQLLLHAELEGQLRPGAAIYSGGCGRAHNEAFLARRGYRVKACDLVPEAIIEATSLYGELPSLELSCEDAFDLGPDEIESYEAVFDRAMLCAIQPENRALYLDAVTQRLEPDGLFMTILFRRVDKPQGPPFAVDEKLLFSLLEDRFELCWAAAGPPLPSESHVREEWLCIWRRRR